MVQYCLYSARKQFICLMHWEVLELTAHVLVLMNPSRDRLSCFDREQCCLVY